MNREKSADTDATPLDEAARAGWLYYVGQKTQDQIAREMGISRQRAQRLVSKAIAEGLIRVRLDHRLSACLALEAELIRRFDLRLSRVAPSLGPGVDPVRAVAPLAAAELERLLSAPDPMVLALGTGRVLRASIEELPQMECPQHKIVSLIGNIAPDGSASFFDVIMRIADKTHAPHFPMPLPLYVSSPEERAQLVEIESIRRIRTIAGEADLWVMGISQIGEDAVLYRDGFMNRSELLDMVRHGAVGEVTGWVFDAEGRFLDRGTNLRVTSVPPEPGSSRLRICIGQGPAKVLPLRAALTGKIINGLVTDEDTARALLAD